jgi:hypothetical protein
MMARGGTAMARGGMVRGGTTTAQGGTAWGSVTKGGITENYLKEKLAKRITFGGVSFVV